MSRWVPIAETALAGALVGYMIGPESLEQFFGMTFRNGVAFNILTGTAIGAVLGLIMTVSQTQSE
ncbi:hypothetical protein [Oricola indica]|jgi:hypothetical protein|uniref:hypothetical protein n=1 Tax=Oricola indica TaxID=2872591 RepID=UPI001CBE9027|nr:hypothetical protein [Oricola indica]